MKVIIRILSAAVLFLTAVIPVFQSHGAQWLWLLLLSEPRFAACQSQGIPWFQSHGQWGGRDYANIAPGDAIFFDWDLDGSADHVGLVVGTDGSRVYTVEGNSGDACKIKSYSLTYECIKGYGLMNW